MNAVDRHPATVPARAVDDDRPPRREGSASGRPPRARLIADAVVANYIHAISTRGAH